MVHLGRMTLNCSVSEKIVSPYFNLALIKEPSLNHGSKGDEMTS